MAGWLLKGLAALCVLVVLSSLESADAKPRPYYYWSNWGSHYFHYSPQYMTWHQAQNYCRRHGGNLAYPMNYHDENRIYWLMRRNPYTHSVWIGVNDRYREGHWVTPTGHYAPYHHWDRSQPDDWNHNEDCVEIRRGSGRWNDLNCWSRKPFICELPRHYWGKK